MSDNSASDINPASIGTTAQIERAFDGITAVDLSAYDPAPKLTGLRVLRSGLRYGDRDDNGTAVSTAVFPGPAALLQLQVSARGRVSAYANVDCDRRDEPSLITFAAVPTGAPVPTRDGDPLDYMGTFATSKGMRAFYLISNGPRPADQPAAISA